MEIAVFAFYAEDERSRLIVSPERSAAEHVATNAIAEWDGLAVIADHIARRGIAAGECAADITSGSVGNDRSRDGRLGDARRKIGRMCANG
jgi:hypothetical protein